MRENPEGRLAEIHIDGKTVNVTFLEFGTTVYEDGDGGYHTVSKGIIEMPNGQVRMVHPTGIKFLPRPNYSGNF